MWIIGGSGHCYFNLKITTIYKEYWSTEYCGFYDQIPINYSDLYLEKIFNN